MYELDTHVGQVLALCGHPPDLFELKIDTPVTPALGNIYTNFVYFCVLVFELEAHVGQADKETDRWMGKICNAAY